MTSEKRQINPENIPHELRQLNQWVVWRYQTRGDKQTKVPYSPHTLQYASTTNPDTWSAFDYARIVLNRTNGHDFMGLGFVFTAHDPYCGIDLDHCLDHVDEHGRKHITSHALDVVLEFPGVYTEWSPSGEGLHMICKAQLPDGRGRKGYGVEVYDRGRYFTITGNLYTPYPENNQPLDYQMALDHLLANPHYFLMPVVPDPLPMPEPADPSDGDGDPETYVLPTDWRQIQVRIDPDAQPPIEKFNRLLKIKHFKQTWEHTRMTHEGSASAIDMALARFAAHAGWSDQDITDLLIYHRRTYGLEKTDRADYYQRTLFNLRTTVLDARLYQDALEKLDDLAASAAGQPIERDSEPWQDTLKTIKRLTNLDLIRYIQYGHSPASYGLELKNGVHLTIPSSGEVRDQSTWMDIAQEQTGLAFPQLKNETWRKFLVALSLIREYEEIPETGDLPELVLALQEYLRRTAVRDPDDAALAHLLSENQPYYQAADHAYFFSKSDFTVWLNFNFRTIKVTGILAKLRKAGAFPREVSAVTAAGEKIRRRYWTGHMTDLMTG